MTTKEHLLGQIKELEEKSEKWRGLMADCDNKVLKATEFKEELQKRIDEDNAIIADLKRMFDALP